jgi:hypothetical protein
MKTKGNAGKLDREMAKMGGGREKKHEMLDLIRKMFFKCSSRSAFQSAFAEISMGQSLNTTSRHRTHWQPCQV